ncbi:MAG: hypothetical protein KGP12_12700 [Actinomycetales bacterium]|nr:hypothetical protein [Actinomycetales bacterium]
MFIDQARWLIAYHDARAEAVSQRSVAVLGFTGVVLALLPSALALPPSLDMNCWLWIILIGTIVTLLGAAVLSLKVLWVRETGVPSARQTRIWLDEYLKDHRRGMVYADVAETFLHSWNLNEDSPVDREKAVADDRAKWFMWSLVVLVIGLVEVGGLVLTLVYQAGRGVT